MDSLLYDIELQDLVTANLGKFKRKQLRVNNLRRAAVTIAIVDYHGESNWDDFGDVPGNNAAVILTRRRSNLNHHAGQWALPGGSIDEGESVVDAALREMHEEVDLVVEESQVFGLLDDFVTRSGFHITPVVVWGGHTERLSPNVDEVASIHRIPCRELLRQDSPVLQPGVEDDRPILFMPIGNTCIATPTAAILYQFREVALLGKTTRVDHFDQPAFAWK